MLDSKEMPNIEFEGKIVEFFKGYYRCPFGCANTDYPQPKWKTVRGFRGHMEKCGGKPSAVAARRAMEEVKQNKYKKIREDAINAYGAAIGDHIFHVAELILKPTHECKFNRMARVRYEAVKKFVARETDIKTIDANNTGCVFVNRDIRDEDIFNSMADAEKEAIRRQAVHKRRAILHRFVDD